QASCPAEPAILRLPLAATSNQMKTELSLAYDPSERLNAVGGFTLSRSSVQADLQERVLKATRVHNDFAAYVQASYRPRKPFKLVAGGRVDYSEIEGRQTDQGFGVIFSPRLAVIYSPGSGRSVYKAIYAEAFQDPSDQERFETMPFIREIPSDGLRPERVRNFELGGDWRPRPGLSLGLAAYQASYRDLIGLREARRCQEGTSPPACIISGQFRNVGEGVIRGAQAQLHYRRGRYELFGNYSFTDPQLTDPRDATGAPLLDSSGQRIDELRIGDIASHRLNLGVDFSWRPNLTSDLRVNYVGARKTGAGTTVPTNPFSEIDPYAVTSTTLTYRLPFRGRFSNSFSNSKVQLILDNLFDVEVFHPGVRQAGDGFAARIPQPGRRVYLRFLTVTPGRRDAPPERAPS